MEIPRIEISRLSLAVLVAMLLIWWQAGSMYETYLISEERGHVSSALVPYGSSLTTAMSQRIVLLEGLDAFIHAKIGSSGSARSSLYPEFDMFAASLYNDSAGIQNMIVAPGGIVSHVYPLKGNEIVLGHNLFRDPELVCHTDTDRALASRQLVLSDPHMMKIGVQGSPQERRFILEIRSGA